MKVLFLYSVCFATILSCTLIKKFTNTNEKYLYIIENFLQHNIPIVKYGNVPDSMYTKRFFHSHEGAIVGYGVFDLTDTTNIDSRMPDYTGHAIKFIQGHFYHISPVVYSQTSYSSIFYLEDNKFKVFKFVNCPSKGANIDDVLKFASSVYTNNKNKEILLNNIKNYKKHFHYIYDDWGSELNCDLLK